MMTVQEMNEVRNAYGLTYQQICFDSGVPISTVQKVLGGITKSPGIRTMEELGRALTPYARRLADERKKNAGASRGNPSVYAGHGAESPAVYAVHEPGSSAGNNYIMKEYWGTYGVEGSSARKLPPRVYTVEDREALPPERRTELIDGVLYDMASPRVTHQIVEMDIYDQIRACIRAHQTECMVFIAPTDVQIDRDQYTMVVPDIFIICDRSQITEKNIQGAPAFILEVLSPSNSHVDRAVKLDKYRNAGVREYWIVDIRREKVIVYHQVNDEDPEVRNSPDNKNDLYKGDTTNTAEQRNSTDQEDHTGMSAGVNNVQAAKDHAVQLVPDERNRFYLDYDVTTYTFTDKIPMWISEGKCVIDMNPVREALAQIG